MVEFPKLKIRKIQDGTITPWKIIYQDHLLAGCTSWSGAMEVAYHLRNNAVAAVSAHILPQEN